MINDLGLSHVELMRILLTSQFGELRNEQKLRHKVTISSDLVCLNSVLKVAGECYAHRTPTGRLR